MARNVRWYIPFKSLQGVSCRINIYDNDWPEYVDPIGLQGADDPFSYSEGDSSDLLNDVLRFRTGYIRVVETGTYGSLDLLFPTTTFERYVEVMYGTELVFNGYIQVQDFASSYIPVPRVLELPVISPLGLFDRQVFSSTRWLPPRDITLGEALDAVLANKTYSRVYFPKKWGYPNTISLSLGFFSLAMLPWSSNYHHSMRTGAMDKVMQGETYAYLIECICKAFGWICHDTPEALIFTAFEYEDEYAYFPVGHIGEAGYRYDAGFPTSLSLADYYSPADDNANVQTLQPETGIEIQYEGESNNHTFSFDRTYADENGVQIMPSLIPYRDQYWLERYSILSLIPVPGLNETNVNGSFTFDSNDKLPVGTHIVAWNGHEGVLLSMSGAIPTDTTMFWIRFYIHKRSRQSYSFKYSIMYRQDGILSGLEEDEDRKQNFNAVVDTSNQDYIQINFIYHYGGTIPQLPLQSLVFIYGMELAVLEDGEPYSEYIYPQAGNSDIISIDGDVTLQGTTPAITSSVTMPISLYRYNDRLIGLSVRSSKLTTYPYLFRPRKQMRGTFRVVSLPLSLHCPLFTFDNKKWRVIAQEFKPWDDEVTLVLQNSSIL
jgi:hypothetical protein